MTTTVRLVDKIGLISSGWIVRSFQQDKEKISIMFLLIEQSREGAFFFLSTKVKDNTSLIKKQTRPKPRANKQTHTDTFLNQTLEEQD